MERKTGRFGAAWITPAPRPTRAAASGPPSTRASGCSLAAAGRLCTQLIGGCVHRRAQPLVLSSTSSSRPDPTPRPAPWLFGP